jgi:molybdopterin molybdotransferase
VLKNIECEKAQDILVHNVKPLPSEWVPLLDAPGRVIAENLYALHDLPMECQAAFDGYALCGLDLGQSFCLAELTLEDDFSLKPGEAARVRTGGILPRGTEAVIPLEQVSFNGDRVLLSQGVTSGCNIKIIGEDFNKDELLTTKGTRFTPGLAGLVAAFGMSQVPVIRRPKVLVLSIGPDIVPHDSEPQPGETRDSNGPLLASLITRERGQVIAIEVLGRLMNDFSALGNLFQKSDLVITTGSTFAGVREDGRLFLEKLRVTHLFSGVQLNPGGHVSAAFWHDKPILMLSGNAAACLVGFELFAVPMLRKLQGLSPALRRVGASITGDFSKQKDVRCFLRAHAECGETGWQVTVLPGQKPSMMRSFLGCNALVDLSPHHPPLRKGDQVPVILTGSTWCSFE